MTELIVSDVQSEALRVMEVCNACRYCEGLCATFQSMALRRTFSLADMDHLANLCHNCTACFHDCQYAAPHEFDINVSTAMTDLRLQSYERYAWPEPLAGLFYRNGLVTFVVVSVALIAVLLSGSLLIDDARLFGTHLGAGAFYQVVPHQVMIVVAGATFGFSVIALLISYFKFANAIRGPGHGGTRVKHLLSAFRDAGRLKYLDGGTGEGCSSEDDGFSNQRRYLHQATMWGFILCFLATSVATIYAYVFGWQAPYGFFSLPVVLGSVGGVGLLIGPAGLWWLKRRSDPRAMRAEQFGMDYAFLASLFLVSLTGFAVLFLRETSAMGLALLVHLGFVLAFFVQLPFSKFVHGIYRFASLVHFARESDTPGE